MASSGRGGEFEPCQCRAWILEDAGDLAQSLQSQMLSSQITLAQHPLLSSIWKFPSRWTRTQHVRFHERCLACAASASADSPGSRSVASEPDHERISISRVRPRASRLWTTGGQSFASVDLPSEISEGDTLELTLGGLATESRTVSVSQTIDPGETLSDVADRLVADLSGLTNDAGDPLSGEVVTVDDGFGGVQTSLQITSTDGSSLGSVEPVAFGRSSGHAEHRSDGRVCGDVGDPDGCWRGFRFHWRRRAWRCRSRVAV